MITSHSRRLLCCPSRIGCFLSVYRAPDAQGRLLRFLIVLRTSYTLHLPGAQGGLFQPVAAATLLFGDCKGVPRDRRARGLGPARTLSKYVLVSSEAVGSCLKIAELAASGGRVHLVSKAASTYAVAAKWSRTPPPATHRICKRPLSYSSACS